MKVDINCDVGEGIENEYLLMPYISSCNIACGGHFGDANSIDKSIQLAKQHRVKIGAHPSFPDTKNFGRKVLDISDEALKESIQNQMDLFIERVSFFDEKLHHIKPHGALFNLIAVDKKAAKNFMNIIQKYMDNIFLYVPYNSEIEKVAIKNNINIKYEAFADRNYNNDGTLVSRNEKNAVINNPEAVLQHVLKMISHGKVQTITGDEKTIKATTFCVHGDTNNSLEILKHLSIGLAKKGIEVG